MDIFFPGISAKYGPNQAAELRIDLNYIKDLESSASSKSLSGHAGAFVEVWIDGNSVTNETGKTVAVVLNVDNIYGSIHVQPV